MVTVRCIATLKTTDEKPLGGMTIDFYYSTDGTTYHKFDSKKTDPAGVAETTKDITVDTWFKAVFEGTADYEPSEAVAKYIVPPPVIMAVSVFGKTLGFAVWSVPLGMWVKADPGACSSVGFVLGLRIWSSRKMAWEKGGMVVLYT